MEYTTNQYALILGVSSGFGKATAIELAKLGYNIYGVHLDFGRNKENAEEFCKYLQNIGVRARFFNANAADDQKRAEIIQAINDSPAKTIAVDIPSGLDCDTGLPLGCVVMAQYTTTFIGSKKGFTHTEAMRYVGKLRVIDIGIPKRFILQSGIVENTICMDDDLTDVAAGL
ncbi:MAG: SDR family NAD(P)-dependent oxidoreductase [Candidatus Kapaibacteriota bacterium]